MEIVQFVIINKANKAHNILCTSTIRASRIYNRFPLFLIPHHSPFGPPSPGPFHDEVQHDGIAYVPDCESVSGPLVSGLSARSVCGEDIFSLRNCLGIRQALN